MFKSLNFYDEYTSYSGVPTFQYIVYDTTFENELVIKSQNKYDFVRKLVAIYEFRKLNVATNIARYYYWSKGTAPFDTMIRGILHDNEYLDRNYKTKYFQCILNQAHRLEWVYKNNYMLFRKNV